MEITHYKNSDHNEVVEFFKEIFEENGWTERESDHFDDPPKLFYFHSNGVFLTIKESGKIIGTAGIKFLNQEEGLIKRFYIKKECRGTGIAQKLMHELEIKAKLTGAKKLILDVAKDNGRAIRFYEKSGFTKMNTTPREGWTESFTPEVFYYYFRNIT